MTDAAGLEKTLEDYKIFNGGTISFLEQGTIADRQIEEDGFFWTITDLECELEENDYCKNFPARIF